MGQFDGKVVFVTGAARGRAAATRWGSPGKAPMSSRSTCARLSRDIGWPMAAPMT